MSKIVVVDRGKRGLGRALQPRSSARTVAVAPKSNPENFPPTENYPASEEHITTFTFPHPRTSLPLNLLSTPQKVLEVNALSENPHSSFIKDSEIVSEGR